MLRIEKIQASDTLKLRAKILRPGFPEEECTFDTDKVMGCIHFGALFNEKLIAISTVFPQRLLGLPGEKHFQIRGMAVDSEYQGQGAGKFLVKECISHAKRLNGSVIWCNAREKALEFYKKLGFKAHGHIFQIDGVGPHQKMYLLIR